MSTPPQLELDRQLCFALYSASRAMTRAYAPVLDPVGLTYPQYITMLVLWEADEPLSVGAIGERLLLDSGTLTPLIKRLEALGHLRRRRDATDERRVLVELTERGRLLRDDVAGVPATMAGSIDLTAAEAEHLHHLLRRVTRSLHDQVGP